MDKKKIENFWYYNKFKVLAAAFIAGVIALCVVQLAGKPNYDYRMLYDVSSSAPPGLTDAVSVAAAKYGIDQNGDGKVQIETVDCSGLPNDPGNRMAAQIRLQGELATGQARIVVADDTAFDTLNSLGAFGKFSFLPDKGGKAVNVQSTALRDVFNKFWPKHPDLYVCLRAGSDQLPASQQKGQKAAEDLVGKLITK